MFSLHERTQRQVCRITFVLMCALPTALVLGWALYFNRPWLEQDWRGNLERALHVRAIVSDVAAPKPWQRELASLQLASLDTSRTLANVRQLSIKLPNSFAADHVEFHWSQLSGLTQVVQIWLAGETFGTTSWHVESAKLTGAAGLSCELRNLHAESGVSSNGVRQIAIGVELEEGQKVRLRIERTADGKLHVALDTQQAALPAWLLACVVPGAARWGQADFSGVLQLEKTNSQVVGKYRGSIKSIDGQEWIGTDQLRTRANLQFDVLSWTDGRIQAAAGQLETGEGQIHQSLLRALKERLYCSLGTIANEKVEYHSFHRTACRFQLNGQGLTVLGTCSSEGCLLVADGKPLVMQPAYSNLPVAHLVQVFCPLQDSWLPATREATSMAERLPLPESQKMKR